MSVFPPCGSKAVQVVHEKADTFMKTLPEVQGVSIIYV